ncbi:MAG: DUF3791 domain-containing protein [Eubacterium sp.]|nr:DUF3791 domain-containing protein [Eubacterium sp.]
MTKEMQFFIYLLEYYAAYKNQTTGDILTAWDNCGITNEIYDNYWLYHTERIENAYADIDNLMLKRMSS